MQKISNLRCGHLWVLRTRNWVKNSFGDFLTIYFTPDDSNLIRFLLPVPILLFLFYYYYFPLAVNSENMLQVH